MAAFIIWILGCLLVGISGSFYTRAAIPGWYRQLDKPQWTPPDWLFGPVWTLLYIAMGVAAALVWRQVRDFYSLPIGLFLLQLGLNWLWSYFFFHQKRIQKALVDLVLLWVALLATILTFWPYNPIAGWLLVPYLLWITFAGALNFSILKRNPTPSGGTVSS
jgi:benzodiazapine receptor